MIPSPTYDQRYCRLVAAILLLMASQAASLAEVRINEILVDPRSYGDSEGISDEPISEEPLPWIELHHAGSTTIDLSGWHLTDSPSNPLKWSFPQGTMISSNGFLNVLVVGSGAQPDTLQTDFKLSRNGEYLALTDPLGNLVDALAPNFPKQFLDHSYGRDSSGDFVYFDTPSPLSPNPSSGFVDRVDRPDFSVAPGFYQGSLTLGITSQTTDAVIRYTEDGSIPTVTSGTLYTGPLNFSGTAIKTIRARAFLTDYLPSRTGTGTYIMNQPAGLTTLPAVSLVGEPEVYEGPNGILSKPYKNGRENEKPTSFEYIPLENAITPGQVDLGIRIVNNNTSSGDLVGTDRWDLRWQRPKFNLFLRGDYEQGTWDYPLFPKSKVKDIDRLRLRLGHQDFPNPFIIDEFVRRTFIRMGHVNSSGKIVALYQNGIFRTHANLVERHRENFFQESYDSAHEWDVRHNKGEVVEGDDVAWDAFDQMMTIADYEDPSDYAALEGQIDLVNFIDYLILNTFIGSQDWPQNNHDIARERSAQGRWRFHIWDAESSLGWDGHPITDNIFSKRLNGNHGDVVNVWEKFKDAKEFQMLFADRVQHHFFNDGPLVEHLMDDEWETLSNILTPYLKFWLEDPEAETTDLLGIWLAGRRPHYFDHLESQDLWPSTSAPTLSQHGGEFTNSLALSINNTESGSTLYYTTDGSDPREFGGAVSSAAQPYIGTITLTSATHLKVRAREGSNWSPLIAASFHSTTPPALRITELMFHPVDPSASEVAAGFLDADAFEFIEIRNIGSSTASLVGVAVTDGVTFDFDTATTSVLAAGERAVVVRDPLAFVQRYGSSIPIIGTYVGAFKNASESVALTGAGGVPIHSFTYSDSWYPSTDGLGFSLEIINDTQPISSWDLSSSWQASGQTLGSPGSANGTGGSLSLPSIAISEIHYHPELGGYEYLEITNAGPTDVPFYDPAHPSRTWKMTSGIQFTFPENLTLAAGAHYLLVPFDPAASSATLNTFVTLYQIPPLVGILGPYTGALSNGGERVTLAQPGTPAPSTPTLVPYIAVDSVTYDDIAPWPTEPDGTGASLNRIDLLGDPNDPTNWQSSAGGTAGNGPPDAYETWLQSYFSLSDLSDPHQYENWTGTGDTEGDGLNLLTEYYFGFNPTQLDVETVHTVHIGEIRSDIIYRRAKTISGVTMSVECSEDDMASWTPMPFTDQLISDEGSYEIRRARIAEGTQSRSSLFYQLRFTR